MNSTNLPALESELPPWPYFSDDEIQLVSSVMRSGLVNSRIGCETRRFEVEFADYTATKFALAVTNGTHALSLAYQALNLKPGDEVITSPRSFIATASCASLLGLKVVFADVNINSGNLDVDSVESLITPRTRAIVVVHLAGWPADMLAIKELANANQLYIVEDCAQAHGAILESASVGSFGDVAAWSFCQDKIMTTCGEGGMITTSNKSYYNYIKSYRDHGKSIQALDSLTDSTNYPFIHSSYGSNYRLTEMQSAVGRYQLSKLDNSLRLRSRNANILTEVLSGLALARIPTIPSNIRHAWYKFYVYLRLELLSSAWSRERVIYEIRSFGFPASIGSCSELYLEECFTFDRDNMPVLPNAVTLGQSSLMFLVHPTIEPNLMYRYANAIRSVLIRATL